MRQLFLTVNELLYLHVKKNTESAFGSHKYLDIVSAVFVPFLFAHTLASSGRQWEQLLKAVSTASLTSDSHRRGNEVNMPKAGHLAPNGFFSF